MKKRFAYLILPLITLVLEILPYGAVLNFANPEGKPWRKTYSYFDLLPFGYANFAPFITAIMTCTGILLILFFCWKGHSRLIAAARNLFCVCAVISLAPLLFGIHYFSVVGVLITFSLGAESLILHFAVGKIGSKE